jgi:hypothetical protein
MNRLTLIKKWNLAFITFFFVVPGTLIYNLVSQDGKLNQETAGFVAFSLALGIVFGIVTNTLCLGCVTRRPVWGSLGVYVLMAYVATLAMLNFNIYWAEKYLDLQAQGGLMVWALLVHVYMFLFTIPLGILYVGINGLVVNYLYRRRDYLPEGSAS